MDDSQITFLSDWLNISLTSALTGETGGEAGLCSVLFWRVGERKALETEKQERVSEIKMKFKQNYPQKENFPHTTGKI